MKLTLVAAVAKNGVIGNKNSLPWYIPEDLKHFKAVTLGKTVLMGKNTFDSIINRLGKPLPERKNVVVSRQSNLKLPEGVTLYGSLDEALNKLEAESEVVVIGGGQVYEQAINRANKLILTEVKKDVEGDVYFPKVDKTIWKETNREDHPEFSFIVYERK